MSNTNTLHTELLSLHALNFAVSMDSSSRGVMFGSHFSQRLVIDGAEEKRIQTGVEQELGKYTFSIKMPVDGTIVKVIDRYPRRMDVDSIQGIAETLVIYEDDQTKELGCFSIPYYTSYHQYFGYQNKLTENMNKLIPGTMIPAGTIFADSPAIKENGGYAYGINLNMCFMSHPAVSEDGVLISRDVLPRLKFKVYETREVEFGSGSFPLNIYGSKDHYKPFPEIGEELREDGMLMVLRPYDYDLMPVEMSIYDTMEIDFQFDKPTYVRGPKGKVVDIKVFHDDSEISPTPSGIMTHVDKYYKALNRYYREIIDTEKQIRSERKKKFGSPNVAIKPELHRLIVEGLAITYDQSNKSLGRLNKLYRKAPLDDYRIEFVIEYEITPTDGFKLTDCHGGKGVITHIAEPEDMPIDEAGNRADVVMDAASIISRMNIGRPYEHYLNACIRDVGKTVMQMLGLEKMSIVKAEKAVQKLNQSNPEIVQAAYRYLLGFYEIVSPRQFQYYSSEINDEDKLNHLASIVNDGIYIYYPIENEPEANDIVQKLEQAYRPTYGPVSYVGNSGQRSMTQTNVRIAPLYLMLLEKIADDWSSVASARPQHFGILSPITKAEKHTYPFRNSPVKTIGETEGRIYAGYCGREAIAEMMDRSNSPMTHKNLVWNILNSDKPTNIDYAVNREIIPLGNSKPLQLINHIALVSGWQPHYEAAKE